MSLARTGLGVLSFAYERGIRVRNAYYDTWAMPVWLDIPVISVGNLTVGGTGKTPMTIWLCERMLACGRKPAVLSRGYKATQHAGADELLLISRRVPQAVAIAHPDRAQAGRLAIAEYHAGAAILDDGFQHRRLGRDLDLLLVDATRPFGYGWVLPRGLLREPISSLRRADAIIVTRCDQVSPEQLEAIEKEIRGWAANVPLVRAVHRFAGFADLAGQPADVPTGPAACFAGIARPEAFVRTLTDIGCRPVDTAFYPDHYDYSRDDVDALMTWARDLGVECLFTTEKDAVKLARLQTDWPVPVFSAVVHMELLDDGERVLDELIDRMLKEHEEPASDDQTPTAE
ncbi:MAG TPA: tetraacyldisaccharide 4'-kinase [Phycisphaerae bacterium]|nr:tetraacyldisaccharide 4'-kinase [Phycisphaerae bacterium]HOJ73987.1 tetraacyldisaccharide 4'-kinase [Phycisphaerae bacterium]HOM50928.1 tetraacyldisaccharide 4'-kinase [Phycisphaerae bacterium]HON67137.1 tetraacyldisaccharide 4'-kinase [Phycisphaerae bacterium]HPP25897.1 tetraacyldisaccharide 4'-kinase [Phycisphaerae bacterium]